MYCAYCASLLNLPEGLRINYDKKFNSYVNTHRYLSHVPARGRSYNILGIEH